MGKYYVRVPENIVANAKTRVRVLLDELTSGNAEAAIELVNELHEWEEIEREIEKDKQYTRECEEIAAARAKEKQKMTAEQIIDGE